MFCELAYGSVSARNAIIDTDKLQQYAERARQDNAELYRSLYGYDEEILEHMKVRRTVRNFRGKYHVERLVIDVDKKDGTDSDTAWHTMEIVDYLTMGLNVPIEHISIFFSGTGYHVSLPDIFGFKPSHNLPRTVAKTMTAVFRNFHTDDIYTNATRLIRVGGTVNRKSGLFKTQISVDDLARGYEHIRTKASVHTPFRRALPLVVPPLPDQSQLIEHVEEEPILVNGITVHTPNATLTPYVTCMQRLWKRGEQRGSRHNDLLRLASSHRRSGLTKEASEKLLVGWAPSLEPYAIATIVNDVWTVPLRYTCEDPVMQSFCSPSCIFYSKKNYEISPKTAEELETEYVNYISSEDFTRSLNLQEFLDLEAPYNLVPGEVAVLIGDTGLGKSTLVQHLCVTSPQLRTQYFSLEMNQHLTYRRFVQAKYAMTKEQVIEYYKTNSNTLGTGLTHINVATAAPKIEALSRIVGETGAQLVIVDTLGCIQTKSFNPIEKTSEAILGLMAIAEKHKTIVLAIHHIGKAAASAGALTVHSGLGSSAVEQQASHVIGVERIDPQLRRVITLKGRDEPPFNVICRFDYEIARFTPERISAERLSW